MPYINPADKLGFLFEAATKQGMDLMPTFIADKRQREQLAQQQQQWQEGAEGRKAVTEHNKFVNEQIRQGQDLFNRIKGVTVPINQERNEQDAAYRAGREYETPQVLSQRAMTPEETVRKVVESGLGPAYGFKLPKEEKQKTVPKVTTRKITEIDGQGNTWEWVENENEEIVGKKHKIKLAPKEKPIKKSPILKKDTLPDITLIQAAKELLPYYSDETRVIDIKKQAEILDELNTIKNQNIPISTAVNIIRQARLPKEEIKIPIPPRPIISNQPKQGLPQGLTEEDINYNMQKYGKTREEVIAAYNKKKGIQ